jgi:hypothetical protein
MSNGCFNRAPFSQRVRMQDGWAESETSRRPVMIEVPFVMEKDCRYTHSDLGQADAKCYGCKWMVEVGHG